jgi:hypothetical protein
MNSISSRQPLFSSCQQSTCSPHHFHAANSVCSQAILQQAALAQDEAQKNKKEAHHKLSSVETPLSVAIGFVIYHAGMMLDPSRNVMKRFDNLLTQNRELRATLAGINTSLVRNQGAVPFPLRLPLSQLQTLLHANDTPPAAMDPYMDQIRQLANNGEPQVERLARQVGAYQQLLHTLMADKPGFIMLARESRIRKYMNVSRQQAYQLALGDRQHFFVKMFGRGLADDRQLAAYQKMFRQLGESYRLRIRLAAFAVPALLFGYFFSKVNQADKMSHQ